MCVWVFGWNLVTCFFLVCFLLLSTRGAHRAGKVATNITDVDIYVSCMLSHHLRWLDASLLALTASSQLPV